MCLPFFIEYKFIERKKVERERYGMVILYTFLRTSQKSPSIDGIASAYISKLCIPENTTSS